jgi:hypothetical protein
MAELTTIDEKIAEVLGLAMAAQDATKKVEGLLEGDEEIAKTLQAMRSEAEETEERCTSFLDEERDGKKTAILEKAQETKAEAKDMMTTYLGEDAEALDGFEFMTMAEAGEVGHWEVLGQLSSQAGESTLDGLVGWALPIQEQHLATARECAKTLAAQEDALATA